MKPETREAPTSELKSSLPSTFGSQPWLIQLDASNKRGQVFINPFSTTMTIKKIKSLEKKICLGSYQEWLLMVNVSSNEPFLFSLITNTEIRLPVMLEQLESLGGFVLSSEPTSPKCNVIITCKNQRYIIRCQPNGAQWIKVLLPKASGIVGQIVILKENLYILEKDDNSNYYGLVVVKIDSLPTGMTEYTIMNGPISGRMYQLQYNYSNHLVVSGENLLLVSFYFFHKEVTEVEAHLLKTPNICWKTKYQYVKNWKRVEISDRRIFFFSKYYNMSFLPHDADKRLNFIYLLQCEDFGEKIYKINLESQTFSSFILPKKLSTKWNSSCWVIPSRSRAKKEKLVSCRKNCSDEKCLAKKKITKKVCKITENISRPWADLPIELVQLLLPYLGLADCIRLPTVCKSWSDLSVNPMLEAKIWPLLMYFSRDFNTCRLFDPICNKEYSLDMEWFTHGEECTLHCSKDGWVLISKRFSGGTYVANPFTREKIKVPCYSTSYPCSYSFYSSPTSEDFMIFVALGDHENHPEDMALWWHGETRWSSWTTEVDYPADDLEVEFSYLNMGKGNAVFLEGLIYCLGRRGDLGMLDPWDDTSQVIYETPVHDDTPAVGSEDCYLLESDSELISVFRERTKTNVRVFMLDHDEWAWNKQEDLGDLTLFLDRRGSVARKLKLGRGYTNRIYLPGFDVEGDRKVGAYYSVDGARYNAGLDSLQNPMNCVWFEPNFTVSKNSEKCS